MTDDLDSIMDALERIDDLEKDNARLRDLVAKFQRGEPSDKFEKHGA